MLRERAVREVKGSIWDSTAPAIVIPTNGGWNTKTGRAVMGAGLALQASRKFPWLSEQLGEKLQTPGQNRVWVWETGALPPNLITFPVKHHWVQAADLRLIIESTRQLVLEADRYEWTEIAMPRVGCGNGRLSWDTVRPALEMMLDDRFTVYHI